jgi:hypothetical protein
VGYKRYHNSSRTQDERAGGQSANERSAAVTLSMQGALPAETSL